MEDFEAYGQLRDRPLRAGSGSVPVPGAPPRVLAPRRRRRSHWLRNTLLLIGAYFAATVYYAIDNENYMTVPFLLLFVLGYWYTGLMSLLQGRFERLALPAEAHSKPFPVGV